LRIALVLALNALTVIIAVATPGEKHQSGFVFESPFFSRDCGGIAVVLYYQWVNMIG